MIIFQADWSVILPFSPFFANYQIVFKFRHMQNSAFASFCAFATFAREILGSILPPQAPNPPVSGANPANQFWKVSENMSVPQPPTQKS